MRRRHRCAARRGRPESGTSGRGPCQAQLVNHLSFRRMRGPYVVAPGQELDLAVPVVDGVPLHELMGRRFYGIGCSLVRPPSRHLLGEPSYAEGGRTVLLDGDCLTAGCCGVMARVVVTETTVRWIDFFARGTPEIPQGQTFQFDRFQYEAALASVDAVSIENLPRPA